MNLSVLIFTAATGLVVANILRKKDNLVKLVGSSASMVSVAAVQFFVFPQLREDTLTLKTFVGGGIIVVSTWLYNRNTSLRGDAATQEALPTIQYPPRETKSEEMPRLDTTLVVGPDPDKHLIAPTL